MAIIFEDIPTKKGHKKDGPLSDAVLVKILFRLPLDTLCRFRCASKAFRDLIAGPAFQSAMFLPTVHGLLLRTAAASGGYRYIPTNPGHIIHALLASSLLAIPGHPADIDVLDSCHGLLLYRTFSHPDLYNVYNVTTRQHLVLPLPFLVAGLDVAGIAFDPRRSRHFKVVLISKPAFKSRRAFEVYSSERGSWFKPRVPVELVDGLPVLPPKKPVFVAGKLHFEALQGKLLRFDFKKEIFDVLPLHRDCVVDAAWRRFGDCGGSLYHAEYDCSRLRLRVWRLDVHERWVPTYSAVFPPWCTIKAFHPAVEGYVILSSFDGIYWCHLCTPFVAAGICRFAHENESRKVGEVFLIMPNFLYSFPGPDRWWCFSPKS
ncbi:F-box/kelch-repeat protein At3g23880-like [Phoenix dactylifera]|uniref:F-box/kelch-repeat protein At3g23880-like n=1 Tax=Phoenix dactylifera TaxID=42345 RepID=A0A8B9ARL3_PHODC|nr:F-box/kelch-repeat protein At3g23880-like [Phoenix dactylifera]